jgi:hypothetical protein
MNVRSFNIHSTVSSITTSFEKRPRQGFRFAPLSILLDLDPQVRPSFWKRPAAGTGRCRPSRASRTGSAREVRSGPTSCAASAPPWMEQRPARKRWNWNCLLSKGALFLANPWNFYKFYKLFLRPSKTVMTNNIILLQKSISCFRP